VAAADELEGPATNSDGQTPTVAVVTPTFRRPEEVAGLLESLSRQLCVPCQVVIVDGTDHDDATTEQVVRAAVESGLPFPVEYLRSARGTAVQRNAGIERAQADLVALIDDDVRLDPSFLAEMVDVFESDAEDAVGGVVGYRTTSFMGMGPDLVLRWRWYRRLRLLSTFEPGAYDWQVGYPINANLQPPFSGVRPVEFMTTACAVWRRQVFDEGLRFDPFFTDYGVLEDAHFSLRAGRRWRLLQCGDAHCQEQSSPAGRVSAHIIGRKSVVNYWFVFNSIAGPLSLAQKFRFWRFQVFEYLRVAAYALRHRDPSRRQDLAGRLDGLRSVLGGEVRRALRERAARPSEP